MRHKKALHSSPPIKSIIIPGDQILTNHGGRWAGRHGPAGALGQAEWDGRQIESSFMLSGIVLTLGEIDPEV